MKLTLEPTSDITTVATSADRPGVPARIWEGTTEDGTRVFAFITRVAVREDATGAELARFERELRETPKPQPSQVWPTRLVL